MSLKSPSLVVILLAAVAWIYTVLNIGEYKSGHVIVEDVISYYSYLPALFIEKDLSLQFLDNTPNVIPNAYWHQELPTGEKVFKMTLGVSVLYAPFFFMAHVYALLTGSVTNGFSTPYQLSIGLSGVFYACMGLLILRKLLRKYYSEKEVAITLLIVCFGTNLYNYASKEAALSHAFSFFLFSALLWVNYKWHQHPTLKKSLVLGCIAGLIILIRPTNIVVLLLVLLYGIVDGHSIKAKLRFLFYHKKQVLVFVLTLIVVLLPQFLYWHKITGSWLVYTYGNEKLYLLQPHIAEVLFSFRKGWLIYTPVMIFALVGISFIKGQARDYIVAIVVFMLINSYVISSWWCWWYGGSYGMRTMVESYALLVIPLAALIHHLYGKSAIIRNVVFISIGIISCWNLYLSYQYKRGILHYDSMTAKAYAALFTNFHKPENMEQLLSPPDYNAALEGKEKYNWK